MKLEDLPSPGIIPNSQKLRVELLKAINYVYLEGMKRGHGGTHVATLATALGVARAAVTSMAYVPVTGVTVANAAALAIGATLQLTATIAPAGAVGYRVVWSFSDPTKVTVSDTGLVRRRVAGAVAITATSVDAPAIAGTVSIP